MQNEYQTIIITDDEMKQHPYIDENRKCNFYRFVAERFGGFDNLKSIDCTKINVAKNIQTSWYEAIRSNPIMNESDLTMHLLLSGPKVNESLPDNTIELEEGAISY